MDLFAEEADGGRKSDEDFQEAMHEVKGKNTVKGKSKVTGKGKLPAKKQRKRRESHALTALEEELVVDLVRNLPMLWDPMDRGYKDKPKKDQAWDDFAFNFDGRTATHLKKWYTGMRDNYVRLSRSKVKSESAAPDYTEREEWLLNAFAFLAPTLKGRQNRAMKPVARLATTAAPPSPGAAAGGAPPASPPGPPADILAAVPSEEEEEEQEEEEHEERAEGRRQRKKSGQELDKVLARIGGYYAKLPSNRTSEKAAYGRFLADAVAEFSDEQYHRYKPRFDELLREVYEEKLAEAARKANRPSAFVPPPLPPRNTNRNTNPNPNPNPQLVLPNVTNPTNPTNSNVSAGGSAAVAGDLLQVGDQIFRLAPVTVAENIQ